VRTNNPCAGNSACITNEKVPLLQNIRTTLVDPDTPDSAKTVTTHDGSTWNLVFSDEFSTPGRTFFEGDDPFFQAVDIWYGATQDLEWYDPDAVTTNNGVLEIRFDAFQNHGLNYRSGMLQSWNQMCFKGGRLEASVSLPGRGDTEGFWPGLWAMGNLARPGFTSTTQGLWPYSYDNVCDAGVTPNQSSTDGISYLPGMRLPACTCSGEDHPTPGTSRSAPEIDVIEASVGYLDSLGNQVGQVSQSFQVAPFDIWYQPNYGESPHSGQFPPVLIFPQEFVEVYNPGITIVNEYKGGPFQEACSAISNLNNQWYDGNAYQVFALEYNPGPSGDATWFVGDQPTWRITADALGPNGNVAQRVLPMEPMSVIMNLGMSPTFATLNFTGLGPLLPATMRFDYIRIYQDPNSQSVTCDPEGYETTPYISAHYNAYTNPNLTTW